MPLYKRACKSLYIMPILKKIRRKQFRALFKEKNQRRVAVNFVEETYFTKFNFLKFVTPHSITFKQ